MFTQDARVHYVDGHDVEVTSDQWALGQWARYANTHGMNSNPEDAGYLSVLFVRYCAFAALFRDAPAAGRPSFETWDRTVAEVELLNEEPQLVDPIEPEQSGD